MSAPTSPYGRSSGRARIPAPTRSAGRAGAPPPPSRGGPPPVKGGKVRPRWGRIALVAGVLVVVAGLITAVSAWGYARGLDKDLKRTDAFSQITGGRPAKTVAGALN